MKVRDGGKERVKLAPNPETAWTVKRMFKLVVSGMGVKEIAKWLNAHGIESPKGKRWGRGGFTGS